MNSVTLDFAGPLASTKANAGVPLFSESSCATSPGIYLQTVALPGSYRVAYVGETGDSFLRRLRPENGAWVAGADRRRAQSGELSLEPYLSGIRSYGPGAKDPAEVRRVRQAILDATLLFLAPLECETKFRRCVEAEIIRALKLAGGEVASFLYNDWPQGRILQETLRLVIQEGVAIDGLADLASRSR